VKNRPINAQFPYGSKIEASKRRKKREETSSTRAPLQQEGTRREEVRGKGMPVLFD